MAVQRPVNILLVDDHPENLLALEGILSPLGENLVRAYSGSEALKHLLNNDFALILLDVQMPDMDGFETAHLIRGRERSQDTPIIFLTAINKSDTHVFRGYSLGAVDYLFKPLVPDVLRSKVAVFVELHRKREELREQAQTLKLTVSELQRQVQEREKAERALRSAHDDLELRVQERTAGLAMANEALSAEIVERQRAEEALRESESRFRRLFESNIVGVTFSDLSGAVHEANDAFLDMIGYSQGDVAAGLVRWDVLTPEEYQSANEQAIAELRAEGICQPYEKEYFCRDGGRVAAMVAIAMLEGSDDQCVAYVMDITSRKHAEEGMRFLAEASRLLASSLDLQSNVHQVVRLSVECIADWCAVDIVKENGISSRVAVASQNTELDADDYIAEYDVASQELPSPGPAAVLHSGRTEFYTDFEAEAGSYTRVDEKTNLLPPGVKSLISVPLETRGVRLGAITMASLNAGRRFRPADVELVETLARRMATAADNARLYEEAEAAIRARDAFLSIASHELKTPLTTLMGYTTLLQRRGERGDVSLSERDQRAIQIVNEQAGRLNRMIGSLLDLSRIQTGQLSIEHGKVDLRELVERLAAEMQPVLDQHTLHCESVAAPVVIEGDELRLEQVVQNLVQNGVKYSPAGGDIRIQIFRRENFGCIAVSDNGIGIPADALPRLFSRFYRANNANAQRIGGIGVGLYVVREIVQLHGGMVDVISREGEGSTFTISLPLYVEEPELAEVNLESGTG